jgi:hypothetical protein
MSARDRARFEAIRARWVKSCDAERAYRMDVLLRRSLVPHWWVMEDLSYEDATTRGALSVVPPCGYGARPSDVERFAAAVHDF